MRLIMVVLMAGGLLGGMPSANAQQMPEGTYMGKDGRKYLKEPGPAPSELFNIPGFKESMEGRAVDAATQAYSQGKIDQDQMMSIVMPAIKSFQAKQGSGL